MITKDLTDTIAVISTPMGESGIGIVRISGKDALRIADRIFVSKDGKKPSEFKTYTVHYGWIINRSQKSEVRSQKNLSSEGVVDEVILTVMRAPKSYTKEDIVEINCHGGVVALRKALDLVLQKGVRLAEPGEFTKRAFLNGRIDLAQAEAVLDIIQAKTDSAFRISLGQLKGDLSNSIKKIRHTLLDTLSLIEANIDFPEEEIEIFDTEEIAKGLRRIKAELDILLDTSKAGRVFREGLLVVICGKTNVGKSSLLNTLLKQERSIVTAVAGTTRDTIEEEIDIKGIPIRIVDTAGIIKPRGVVEKKAILRSKRYIEMADLVILIFDGSRDLAKEDNLLINKLKGKRVIAVINKMDLKQKIDRAVIIKNFNHTIKISAKKAKNINLLEDRITDFVYQGKTASPESLMLCNLRHIEAVREAQKLVAEACHLLDNKLSLELVAQSLKDALGCLDSILGMNYSEDLLDKIFSEFCIGK